MPTRRTQLISTAVTATLTTALTVALAGCSGEGDAGPGADGEPGTTHSAHRAEPGKYETLPDPCGTVDLDTLSDLLPVAESTGTTAPANGAASGTPRAYEGERSVTYDADRRVGCRWKSATTLGSRHLDIDFERVVSYDGEVSDEDKAEQLYTEKASAADIPDVSPSASGSPPPSEEAGEEPLAPRPSATTSGPDAADGRAPGRDPDAADGRAPGRDPDATSAQRAPGQHPAGQYQDRPQGENPGKDEKRGDHHGDDGASDSPSTPPTPDPSLTPRTLDGIGDAAFVDDVLDTTDSGVHRDITLVFRTSNVLVTVEYSQWMTDKHRIPDSAELQEKAESLAKQLASAFDD